MLAAVEAEGELIEIGLQVFAAQPVINAKPPSFQVRKQPGDAGKDDMRRHRPDDMRLMAEMRHSGIRGKPIGLAVAPVAILFFMNACGVLVSAEIRDRGQPRPAQRRFSLFSAFDFDGPGDKQLAILAAALTARGPIILDPKGTGQNKCFELGAAL